MVNFPVFGDSRALPPTKPPGRGDLVVVRGIPMAAEADQKGPRKLPLPVLRLVL